MLNYQRDPEGTFTVMWENLDDLIQGIMEHFALGSRPRETSEVRTPPTFKGVHIHQAALNLNNYTHKI